VLDYVLDTPLTSSMVMMPTGTLALNYQQFTDFNFTPTANFGPGNYTLIEAGLITGNLSPTNTSGMVDGFAATLAIENNQELVLSVVPEPSTLALLAAGAMGLAAYVWRRRRQAA
jgi:hypothetical protein